MKVEAVQVECEGSKQVAAIACGDDLLLLSYDGPAKMKCRNVSFEGTALLLRRDAKGAETYAHMVDGRHLSIRGKGVFSTDAPTPARSVRLP